MTDDESLEFEEETTEDLNEFPEEETTEDLTEFPAEETTEEEITLEEAYQESNVAESTMEISGEVQVINFDSWETPLNSCSAVTISVLLILFFLALATIGGVLNE